jgi:hypothetical protein
MKILIQSLFVFIEESERKRELIDKVIQLSERLPGSVLKSAFDLPMKKSVEMVNRYPKLGKDFQCFKSENWVSRVGAIIKALVTENMKQYGSY